LTLVLDTSVAVKWVVEEPGSDRAIDLASRPLIAPDLFQAEVGGALTKKVRQHELSAAQARRGFDLILSRVKLLPTEAFGDAALDLSLLLSHSIYDCYFLAAAQVYGPHMVTADAIFARKVRATRHAPAILLLGEDIPDD
jgi:predicted nucleic acid-binding protein